MKNFLKGIIVGIGGVSPGLSGSVLLVIFGLYEKTITNIGTLLKDFKNNVKFLLPLFMGFGLGILLFSRVINYLLINHELYTRYAFLGLILGTIPIFYKETKKQMTNKKYYYLTAIVFIISWLLLLNGNFSQISNPNLGQSIILGFTVAGSMIIPGVDSAAILSGLGMYNIYINAISNLNFTILLPAGIGLIIGLLLISYIMNKLLKNYHALTMTIIFGLFLSIIPNIIFNSGTLSFNFESLIAILFLVVGYFTSCFFEKLKAE